MEFAIQLGGGQAPSDRRGIDVVIEQAELAEALGFDAVFVADHYVYEAMGQLQTTLPTYDVFFAMATLAQRTRRIRIGSHVVCLLFRHPAMTARLFAQVDEASGGRVIAGVGAGWTRAEFAMMGIPFPPVSERLRILDEAVTIIRSLWRDETTTFHGNHFTLTDAVCRPKPVQQPGPPLMIGGSGPGILRRAGAWADVIHMVPKLGEAGTTSLDEIRAFTDEALSAKLALVRASEHAAGRAPGSVRFASTIFVYTPTDAPAATRAVAEQMGGMFGLPPEPLRMHPSVLIGTPDEMAAELLRRRRAHGLGMLVLNFPSTAHLRAFGEEVIPRVRAAGA
jgi:probable F420-dependent oxidoreductase